ncbi:ECF-type sigma factor [Tahibacter amnicola]|uniref:ECF-type sigma factor n=1 Tax=Tahibacter amnicola TaxID=2976241 RepID=A0ABY6BIK3_9GAMM|nr:ECF-type sigma factor [Tahibacter amnicola]UXI69421.1 ECF-type sigma factor [Tahibacter amnicola]
MEPGEFTQTLARCREGDTQAQQRLIELVYADLKQVARRHLGRNRWIGTLDTTALLHESYLRIAGDTPDVANRAHFLNLASRIMRQVICDHARKRLRQRAHAEVTPMDELSLAVAREAREVVAVDDALADLARTEPRQAQVVECRFFGGLSVEETAQALSISVRTVERDWTQARQWLAEHLVID